jgi:hypothetical protein
MYDKTAPNANAFASTFYFCLCKMQPHQKIKRASKQRHWTVQGFSANLTRQSFDRKKSPAGNKGFAMAGIPCFPDTFVQGGSSVLRMKFTAKTPHLRQARKRY